MTSPSRFWSDLSTRDFAQLDLARTIAVLPVAATEQHGPHLPLNVDTRLVDGVVSAALLQLPAELTVLFLPTQAIGLSPEHLRFPGTLTLKAETLIALWTQIGESVARAGIKKMVLLNSHGGQIGVLDIVARDLRERHNMLLYSVNWFSLPLGAAVDGMFSAEEHRFGIHAGEIETSMMLALAPEQVDMAQAQNFASSAQLRAKKFDILGDGKSAKFGWQIQDYNAQGAVGNAAAATADKGRAVLDAAGLALAQLLTEIDSLPLNTLVDQPAYTLPRRL
ncbi:MAG: creatininase family protein [Burkholderiaceae bacterium]